MGVKLVPVVLKVSTVLGKELLEGFFISLMEAGLVYLIGLGLLGYIEKVNFLLERYNLYCRVLNIIIATNIRGGRSLKYYYIFILLS